MLLAMGAGAPANIVATIGSTHGSNDSEARYESPVWTDLPTNGDEESRSMLDLTWQEGATQEGSDRTWRIVTETPDPHDATEQSWSVTYAMLLGGSAGNTNRVSLIGSDVRSNDAIILEDDTDPVDDASPTTIEAGLTSGPSSLASLIAIPVPVTMLVAGCGAVALIRRRRKCGGLPPLSPSEARLVLPGGASFFQIILTSICLPPNSYPTFLLPTGPRVPPNDERGLYRG